MADLWDGDTGDASDFVLPGDDQFYAEVVEATSPPEPVSEEQPATRPRDEKGRFASPASDQDEEPTDHVPAEPEPELILGKFKTPDDLAKAYQEAEAAMRRAQQEAAEARRLAEQQQVQQQPPPQPEFQQQYNWDEIIAESPRMAAAMAYQAGDQFALERAARAWEMDEPGAYRDWANTQMELASLKEELNEIRSTVTPLSQRQADQSAAQVYAQFASQHPDVQEHGAEMARIAGETPYLASILKDGDPQAQMEVLDFLYTKATQGKAQNNADNLAVAVRNAAADADREIQEAQVVSATTTVPATAKLSRAQQIAAEIDALEAPYTTGWNI